jgi:type IV pilus assembly protein PilQ
VTNGSESISLNVDNQEIRVILRNIAELFELNLVIPDDLTGRTSLNLKDVTWQQVFNIVLEEKGYSWQEVGGIIRIRRGTQTEAGEDPRVQVLGDGTLQVEFRSAPVADILSLIAQRIQLNVVIPPSEVLASPLDLRLAGVTWQQVFRVTLGQFGFGYIEEGGIVIVRSLDEINSVPDVSRVFHVKYSDAESIAKLLQSQSGVKGVVTDPRSNVVIVTGNPSRFTEIKALIETLDRPTPQVMIESRFVEVSNRDTSQVGIEWASLFSDEGYGMQGAFQSRRDRTGNLSDTADDRNTSSFQSTNERTGAGTASSSLIDSTINQVRSLVDSSVVNTAESAIFSAEAFNLVLRALKRLNDSKIVSNPTVLALNGQEAEIKIIDHYYVQRPGTVSEDGRVVPGEVERLDPLPGIELKVTPTISGGDFISLKVVPQVNDIVGTQTFTNGSVPIVRQRTALTQVMVKDRETLAIGGLIDEKDSKESSKIPLLGSVPGLGRLFRYDSNVTDSKNQIIFITATILNPNETNYIDVVGVDRLNQLGLTERDVVGSSYQMTTEERALQEAILQYRRQVSAREREEKLMQQVEAFRKLEERQALDALKDLEKTSQIDLGGSRSGDSASAMERLKGNNKRAVMPVF